MSAGAAPTSASGTAPAARSGIARLAKGLVLLQHTCVQAWVGLPTQVQQFEHATDSDIPSSVCHCHQPSHLRRLRCPAPARGGTNALIIATEGPQVLGRVATAVLHLAPFLCSMLTTAAMDQARTAQPRARRSAGWRTAPLTCTAGFLVPWATAMELAGSCLAQASATADKDWPLLPSVPSQVPPCTALLVWLHHPHEPGRQLGSQGRHCLAHAVAHV